LLRVVVGAVFARRPPPLVGKRNPATPPGRRPWSEFSFSQTHRRACGGRCGHRSAMSKACGRRAAQGRPPSTGSIQRCPDYQRARSARSSLTASRTRRVPSPSAKAPPSTEPTLSRAKPPMRQ
jgi:hypothetical protein